MLKKQFLKTKCKVTFVLPESLASDSVKVYLVGDFNNWDETATLMELKAKSYQITVDLPLDQDFQFRYLVHEGDNPGQWHNDWHADRYVPNPFSGDNSVVSTRR
ncbi:MAG: isoamylase early set domain-containing protein [Anaerolineae bacterium]|nr:isoamylase early set domain-containing protein [Anaerolineae bacterium]